MRPRAGLRSGPTRPIGAAAAPPASASGSPEEAGARGGAGRAGEGGCGAGGGFVRSAVPSRAARRPFPRGAVTRGGVCCGECTRASVHASATTRERLGSDSRRTLHTRPPRGHRASPKAVLPPQRHPPGRRGGPFKAGWSPVPNPRAAPGSDRLSPVWGGEIDRHHLPPQPGSAWTPMRGPGPQPGHPGAGAGVGTPGRAPCPAAPIAAFPTPTAPGAVGNRGPHTEPTQAPQGAGGLSRPRAGWWGGPVAYLGPQRRKRRAGAAARSAPWARRGAGAGGPCPLCIGLPLALGLGAGSCSDTPLPGSARAPPR